MYVLYLYTGTGRIQDIGDGKGAYYNLNIPLKDGISTQQYIKIFKRYVNNLVIHNTCKVSASLIEKLPLYIFDRTCPF